MLRDRIVLGVYSKNLRKRLLQERKLTLKKRIDICRSVEAATNQFKAVFKTEAEDVNKVGYDNHRKSQQFNQSRKVERNLVSRCCKFCGGQHTFQKEQCPVWGHRCHNCGGRNHFSKKCSKSRGDRPSAFVKQLDEESGLSDVEFITSATTTINAVEVETPVI